MEKNRISIPALPIAVALLISVTLELSANPQPEPKYASSVHPEIVEEAMNYYKNGDGALFTEISGTDIANMKTGSYDEDRLYLRSYHHFYDRAHNLGLTIGDTSYVSAKDWAFNQYSNIPGGVHTWRTAIDNIQGIGNGTGSREKAFIDLGHVLHLIQDMTVPAHARNSVHITDFYEDWTPKYFAGKYYVDPEGYLRDAGAGYDHMLSGTSPPGRFASLEEYFDALSSFSQENFYSDDTIDRFIVGNAGSPDPDGLTLQADVILDNPYDKKKFDGTYLFYYRELVDDGKTIRYRVAAETIFGKSTKNIFVVQDYYKILYRKAMMATAGVVGLFLDKVSANPPP